MAGRETSYIARYAEEAYKLCLLGATDAEMENFFGVSEGCLNMFVSLDPTHAGEARLRLAAAMGREHHAYLSTALCCPSAGSEGDLSLSMLVRSASEIRECRSVSEAARGGKQLLAQRTGRLASFGGLQGEHGGSRCWILL